MFVENTVGFMSGAEGGWTHDGSGVILLFEQTLTHTHTLTVLDTNETFLYLSRRRTPRVHEHRTNVLHVLLITSRVEDKLCMFTHTHMHKSSMCSPQ